MDYAAKKGAMHAFTKSLAQNLVERKMRVNCVAPGPIWTPFPAPVLRKQSNTVEDPG
jgi:NAD(P)-dependent dehydrogenase (short-subunit alcohol dehydrogenase family)